MEYTIKVEIIGNLDCIVVYPKGGHDSTFVYCAGAGGNAQEGFLRFLGVDEMAKILYPRITRTTKIVYPSSSLKREERRPALIKILGKDLTAKTKPFGPPWFSYVEFDYENKLFGPLKFRAEEFLKSAKEVEEVVLHEVKQLNGRSEKVFLGGMSQGAMLSFYLTIAGLNDLKGNLGGTFLQSGFVHKELIFDFVTNNSKETIEEKWGLKNKRKGIRIYA